MRTLLSLTLLAFIAAAPSTQPGLEVRANTAFENGQYAMALPMLQKLEQQFKDQPDKLGPIAEKIQVCQTNLAQAGLINKIAPAEPTGPRTPHAPPKAGEVRKLTI